MVYIKESVVKLLTGLRAKKAEYTTVQNSASTEAAPEPPTEQPSSPRPVSGREQAEEPQNGVRSPLSSPLDNGSRPKKPSPTTSPRPMRIDTTSIRDPPSDRVAPTTPPVVSSPSRLSLESATAELNPASTQSEMKLRSPRIIGTRDAPNSSSVPVNLKSLRRLSFSSGHASNLDDEGTTLEDNTTISETSKENHKGWSFRVAIMGNVNLSL